MSHKKILRVLSYDISDDRRRRRVATILEGSATRVQYSVFEARLSDAGLKDVVGRIKEVIAGSDNLRVYTISRIGERRCEVFGPGIPVDDGSAYWVF